MFFLNKCFSMVIGLALSVGSLPLSARTSDIGEFVSFQVGRHSNILNPFVVAAETGNSVSQNSTTFDNPDRGENIDISAHLWKGAFARLGYYLIGETKVNFNNGLNEPATFRQEAFTGRIGYQYPERHYGAHVYGEVGSAFINLRSNSDSIRRGAEFTVASAAGADYFWQSGIGVSINYARLSGDAQMLSLNVGYRLSLKTQFTRLNGGILNQTAAEASILEVGSGDDVVLGVPTLPENLAQGAVPTSTNSLADADADGVSDSEDYCVDTMPGETVDKQGCAVLFQGVTFTEQADINTKRLLPEKDLESKRSGRKEIENLVAYLSVPDLGALNRTQLTAELNAETLPTAASTQRTEGESPLIEEHSVIRFNRNSSELLSSEKAKLSHWVTQLKQPEAGKIILEVYADQSGNVNYRYFIANKQANSVKNYLVKQGVDAKQVIFKEISVLDQFTLDPSRSGYVYISQ